MKNNNNCYICDNALISSINGMFEMFDCNNCTYSFQIFSGYGTAVHITTKQHRIVFDCDDSLLIVQEKGKANLEDALFGGCVSLDDFKMLAKHPEDLLNNVKKLTLL